MPGRPRAPPPTAGAGLLRKKGRAPTRSPTSQPSWGGVGGGGEGGGCGFKEEKGKDRQTAAEQASVCGCDGQEHRELQGPDRLECQLRHLSGRCLLRQGDRSP